ncbi:hypothetical protein SAMN05216308_11735 [Nitrosospira sp. Nsp13]|nr:hypothetical protein SAMN05216308_11735 [Nitrosospira sp. Nsp13]
MILTLFQHSFRAVVVILVVYYDIGRSTMPVCILPCGIITSQNYMLLIDPQRFRGMQAVV